MTSKTPAKIFSQKFMISRLISIAFAFSGLQFAVILYFFNSNQEASEPNSSLITLILIACTICFLLVYKIRKNYLSDKKLITVLSKPFDLDEYLKVPDGAAKFPGNLQKELERQHRSEVTVFPEEIRNLLHLPEYYLKVLLFSCLASELPLVLAFAFALMTNNNNYFWPVLIVHIFFIYKFIWPNPKRIFKESQKLLMKAKV